jgi:hypothetical protein
MDTVKKITDLIVDGQFNYEEKRAPNLLPNYFDCLDNEPILSQVIGDLYAREKKGLQTYGTTLDNARLSNSDLLNHLYEELLDAAMYIKALKVNIGRVTTDDQGNRGITETAINGITKTCLCQR